MAGEPFGMGSMGCLERGIAIAVDGVCQPVGDVGGCVHGDSGVAVVVVVGVHELVEELPGVTEGTEPVGEDWQVLIALNSASGYVSLDTWGRGLDLTTPRSASSVFTVFDVIDGSPSECTTSGVPWIPNASSIISLASSPSSQEWTMAPTM